MIWPARQVKMPYFLWCLGNNVSVPDYEKAGGLHTDGFNRVKGLQDNECRRAAGAKARIWQAHGLSTIDRDRIERPAHAIS